MSDTLSGHAQTPSITVSAAARQLGVSPSTIRRWTDIGQLGCYCTPGGQRRFSEAGLDRFVTMCRRDQGLGEPRQGKAKHLRSVVL